MSIEGVAITKLEGVTQTGWGGQKTTPSFGSKAFPPNSSLHHIVWSLYTSQHIDSPRQRVITSCPELLVLQMAISQVILSFLILGCHILTRDTTAGQERPSLRYCRKGCFDEDGDALLKTECKGDGAFLCVRLSWRINVNRVQRSTSDISSQRSV